MDGESMTLPYDVCRCMGQAKEGGPCEKRDECARYLEMETGGHRTPYTASMCAWSDGEYEYFITVVEE